MEIHEIRYFLAASRTLNFHRAADLANVTQPALTRAIQKLEAELGGLLFHRERNHVQLTDFGCLMRGHLEEVVRRSEAAKESARDFLRLEAAPLTLGVMCTIGPLRFVGFLNAFHEKKPGIGVTVIEGVPSRLTEMLLQGKLDVALMAQPAPFQDRLRPAHLIDPREVVPDSNMPAYAFLARTALRTDDLSDHLAAQRALGVPYTDEMIANAARDAYGQANPDSEAASQVSDRYGDATQITAFDGVATQLTEMDALVAYLQVLGRLTDAAYQDTAAPEEAPDPEG